MKIGGLDIGTTGCKLTVFDTAGERLAQAAENAIREDAMAAMRVFMGK